MEREPAPALFVGRTYFDVTFVTPHVPEGDEKAVADDYAFCLGGNAVIAGLCCAKLGTPVDLLTTIGHDPLGQMATQRFGDYGVQYFPRAVARSAVSLVRSHQGKRAILRCRDEDFLEPFPHLEVDQYRIVHFDGHQPDAAVHYAKLCREKGILTSLDGGSLRENTAELLDLIDVAVVSERLCDQMGFKTPDAMLQYLRRKGCIVGAVTLGDQGVDWYHRDSGDQHLEAFTLSPELVIDTNGAGDTFHGAYVYSWLRNPDASWENHFRFAAAASAHAVQQLGNEDGLPVLANVEAILNRRPQLAASA